MRLYLICVFNLTQRIPGIPEKRKRKKRDGSVTDLASSSCQDPESRLKMNGFIVKFKVMDCNHRHCKRCPVASIFEK